VAGQAWLRLREVTIFKSRHYADHFFLKLNLSAAKMCFPMVIGTKGDYIRHSICSFISEGDDVMRFQIT